MPSANKPYNIRQWQVLVRDAASAANFYKVCFGWSTSNRNSMGYRSTLDSGLAGGIWPIERGTPAVQLFVGVPNVDEAVALAIQSGARVAIAKQVLPDGDEMAVIIDPEGIAWGVMLDGD